MADTSAVVRGMPPWWLRRWFELTAVCLRAMGLRRYVIADVVGLVVYVLQPRAKRRVAARIHSRAAGGLPARAARQRARASYRAYSRMIVDTVWIHAVDLSEIFEHGRMDHLEHLADSAAAGRGGILVLCHFGSWDAGASFALAAGYPLASVMAPVGPQWVTDLIAWSRRAKQMELYSPTAAARGLLRALRGNRFVALLVDIPEGGPTVVVPFCNGPVRFSVGPAFLARATGAPIIPVDCWREPAGYHVRFHTPFHPDPTDDHQAVMARVARELEAELQRHPDQWYPFNPIYTDELPAPAA